LKVAFVRSEFDPYGGAELFTQRLIEALTQKGVEVHVFARKWKCESDRTIYLHRIRGPGSPSFLRHAVFVYFVKRELRKHSFDLIQSNERTLSQDVYRAGDGVHARWLDIRCARLGFWRKLSIKLNPFHRYLLWLEKKMFEDGGLKAVIVNSNMVKQEILSRFAISDEKIHIIYNGVDLARFHPRLKAIEGRHLRRQNGVGDNDLLILFVGSGFGRKGVMPLLEAVAKSGGGKRLWIVGKGDVKRYQRRARELGIQEFITFCGPQANTPAFYAAADVFALPTMYDPFPSVILEAMASGLPVITTTHSGAAEIITPGKEGYVVSAPEAVEEIAFYLDRLADRECRSAMGVQARLLAEHFPMEKTVEEILQLYRDEIDKGIPCHG